MTTIISVINLGKAYKQYQTRWSRFAEWFLPRNNTRYQLKWVLKNINFKVNAGESIALMGINGAGKSTLLKMITGTTQPTCGYVEKTGRISALLELGMGFHPDFTGRQNVYMSGQLNGLNVHEIDHIMPDIEDFAEIGEYIDQPVRIYSSGMYIRLAFSIATAVRPEILIVDEALSVGDAYFQAKCYKRISTYREAGTTLLFVSHNPSDVVKNCERAILLRDGHIAADGISRDVTNLYMDILFGEKKSFCTNTNLVKENFKKVMDTTAKDIFFTRPGYNKNEYRWGKGGASILDYKIVVNNEEFPSTIECGMLTDFYFKVRFEKNFAEVVPGFLLKTLEGIFLYGTNSFFAKDKIVCLQAQAGNIFVYKFSLRVHLNEGNYLVSFGISSGSPLQELVPLDRRYDSVIICVRRDPQFWGIVDLNASFSYVSLGPQ